MSVTLPLLREWVGPDYRDQLSTQSYGARDAIDGVRFVDLRLFADEGGSFCEVTRFDESSSLADFPGWRAAQISYSSMEPGAIKAWHLHQNQDDLWFVPPHDRLLIGLLDVRDGSPTYDRHMRLTMGTGKPQLLFIPRGVAHGAANLSSSPASMMYFVNRPFDLQSPDEHRLPWDLLGKEFWTIQPG